MLLIKYSLSVSDSAKDDNPVSKGEDRADDKSSADEADLENRADDNSSADPDNSEGVMEFSIEEEIRYARRLDEGYNLVDPRYEAWLMVNDSDQPHSQPLIILPTTLPCLPNTTQSSSVIAPSPLPPSQTPLSQLSSSPPSQTPAPSEPGVVTTPKRPTSNTKCSPLSELLSLPVRKGPKSKTGHARVLTSNECLTILKEKEEKKKREAEEKEKRKEEKLLKRSQKEEEQKRKDEERTRKVAEREEKRKRLEQDKIRKAAGREALKAKRLAENSKQAANRAAGSSTQAASSTSQGDADGRPVRKKLKCDVDSTVYTDLCCVCFGAFEDDEGTGREWLKCSCGRWIHEDCVVPHSGSSERLCPLC